MGFMDSDQIFLSEKNMIKLLELFNFPLRPAIEAVVRHNKCQSSPKEEQEQEDQDPDRVEVVFPLKKLKVKPLPQKELGDEDKLEVEVEGDGFKTPTSSEHKIPTMLTCPGAPRKPKQDSSKKRPPRRPRIPVDFSRNALKNILLPNIPFLEENGSKIKKARQEEQNDSSERGRGC